MSTIRQFLEEQELKILHPLAARSIDAERDLFEPPSEIRLAFQRDRDRIIHCKSFRRLKHKTQVFISPEGDHYRTRLTHTLELSQIARTIARALRLNEDLTEAIALGHDLGHTPFGHIGEAVINELFKIKFKHYEQSLRVVEKLERQGAGLNLTKQVREGIVKHSKGMGAIIPESSDLPSTLEGQIVRIADLIAYVNHDLDDALRAGIIREENIPAAITKTLGENFGKRIDTIVKDVIAETVKNDYQRISISQDVYQELLNLRDFLNKNVYQRAEREAELIKIKKILLIIYEEINSKPDQYIAGFPAEDHTQIRIIDFIAGMTDRYALNLFKKITLPESET